MDRDEQLVSLSEQIERTREQLKLCEEILDSADMELKSLQSDLERLDNEWAAANREKLYWNKQLTISKREFSQVTIRYRKDKMSQYNNELRCIKKARDALSAEQHAATCSFQTAANNFHAIQTVYNQLTKAYNARLTELQEQSQRKDYHQQRLRNSQRRRSPNSGCHYRLGHQPKVKGVRSSTYPR